MKQEELSTLTCSALIGQAVGDAFGVPVEFLSRAEVRALGIRDMVGCDTPDHPNTKWAAIIPAGSWSDDTSMTLASMASFANCGGRFDPRDQMTQFVNWWENKQYCCLNMPFGLGGSVAKALDRFVRGGDPSECGGREFNTNGNGALMRILPFSLYCIHHGLDEAETAQFAGDGSALTHAHEISRMCCFVWTELLRSLAEEKDLSRAIDRIEAIDYAKYYSPETLDSFRFLTEKRVRSLTEEEIAEDGFVVETLKTALFSLVNSSGFESAILTAVGLGGDSDTSGAVTGTAAGILYGLEKVPERWVLRLQGIGLLLATADSFARSL